MEQSAFQKLIVTQLLKKLPAFYGIWRFITMLWTHHWTLSWIKSSLCHHLFLSYLTNVLLVPRSQKLISSLPKILYTFIMTPMCAILLCCLFKRKQFCLNAWFYIQIIKLWSLSSCIFLELLVTSSLFGPHILLSDFFWNTLSLCSSITTSDT